jgi:hypothetical protein
MIPESVSSLLVPEVVALKAAGINRERVVNPRREVEVCATGIDSTQLLTLIFSLF